MLRIYLAAAAAVHYAVDIAARNGRTIAARVIIIAEADDWSMSINRSLICLLFLSVRLFLFLFFFISLNIGRFSLSVIREAGLCFSTNIDAGDGNNDGDIIAIKGNHLPRFTSRLVLVSIAPCNVQLRVT